MATDSSRTSVFMGFLWDTGKVVKSTWKINTFGQKEPVIVSVTGKNNCEFKIEEDECKRILNKVIGCKNLPSLRIGGEVENSCATWVLDPIGDLQGECIPIPGLATWCRLIQLFAG